MKFKGRFPDPRQLYRMRMRQIAGYYNKAPTMKLQNMANFLGINRQQLHKFIHGPHPKWFLRLPPDIRGPMPDPKLRKRLQMEITRKKNERPHVTRVHNFIKSLPDPEE